MGVRGEEGECGDFFGTFCRLLVQVCCSQGDTKSAAQGEGDRGCKVDTSTKGRMKSKCRCFHWKGQKERRRSGSSRQQGRGQISSLQEHPSRLGSGHHRSLCCSLRAEAVLGGEFSEARAGN